MSLIISRVTIQSTERKWVLVQVLSHGPSVQCTVEKRLIGSGCIWGGGLAGSRDEAGRCPNIVPHKGTILGVDVGCPIVTNGNFVEYLRKSAFTDRAALWSGEWGQARHWCIRCGSK